MALQTRVSDLASLHQGVYPKRHSNIHLFIIECIFSGLRKPGFLSSAETRLFEMRSMISLILEDSKYFHDSRISNIYRTFVYLETKLRLKSQARKRMCLNVTKRTVYCRFGYMLGGEAKYDLVLFLKIHRFAILLCTCGLGRVCKRDDIVGTHYFSIVKPILINIYSV